MKTTWLLAAAAILVGCGDKPAHVRATLDCPATTGEFRLTAVGSQGETCTYRGPEGSEATLRRVAVAATAPAALQPIEDEVWAGRRNDTRMRVEVAPGGLKVSDGERPPVVLPRIYPVIRNAANDVFVGGVRVKGDPAFAIIRYERAMPLRARPFSREKGLVRGLVHTGERLPGGYRTLAYEAAGPTTGPLTVVVFRSQAVVDDLPPAVRRLARDNGGV